MLAEQYDERLVARRYLSMESLNPAQAPVIEVEDVVPELTGARLKAHRTH